MEKQNTFHKRSLRKQKKENVKKPPTFFVTQSKKNNNMVVLQTQTLKHKQYQIQQFVSIHTGIILFH